MQSSKAIRFPTNTNTEFFQTLRHRVQEHFTKNKLSKFGNLGLYVKSVLLYVLYLGSFGLILFGGFPPYFSLILCVTMGLGLCGLGVNVMHDSLHGSYAENKTVNKIMSFTMEILGGSTVTWKIQHNMMHHTYTNVFGMDEDIDDKPFLRLSPDGKLRWYHRFQHFYAPILYGLSNASWLIQKDFKQFVAYWKQGILKKAGFKPTKEFIKLLISKAFYFGIVLALPMYILPVAWYWVIIGFLIVQFVGGILMTLIFLTAHAVEDAHHYQPDNDGNLENNWAIHQLRTTANFNTKKNPLLHWYVGGLNHQIEHHLFPQISHVHYGDLAPIVRKTAKEFGIEYMEYPSFSGAIGSHFRYLRDIGRGN